MEQAPLTIPPEERMLNRDGVSQRFSFSAYGYMGDEGPISLLGAFESTTLGWPSAIPKQPAPGKYVYEYLDSFFFKPKKPWEISRGHLQTTFGLASYYMPLSPALEKKANADSDVLLVSQDSLIGKKLLDWGDSLNLHSSVNPNNPAVLAYMQDYLKNLAAYTAKTGKMDFFLTAWECNRAFDVVDRNGGITQRFPGHNPSARAAFRDYLQERYSTIEALNRRWHASYPSFTAVEPPDDRIIRRPTHPSGLVFEFERWSRLNLVRYLVNLRKSLKEGAPHIPVMEDASAVFAEMDGYLMFKENVADVYSFHTNPSWEEMIWTYFTTMRRKFGKELGYYENYWGMFTSTHLKDERLAQRDVRTLFFDLLMCDIRWSTWWLHYSKNPTDYVVAYGGGVLGLDYDQTILRWSTTELARCSPAAGTSRRPWSKVILKRPRRQSFSHVRRSLWRAPSDRITGTRRWPANCRVPITNCCFPATTRTTFCPKKWCSTATDRLTTTRCWFCHWPPT